MLFKLWQNDKTPITTKLKTHIETKLITQIVTTQIGKKSKT